MRSTTVPSTDMAARMAATAESQGQAPRTVAQLVQDMRPELARVLPAHLDADRLARIALTVLRRTPDLALCDQATFMGALMSAAELGLEPGVSGECYLVPRRNRRAGGKWEATLVLGYQGLAKLVWQSGQVRTLDTQAVYPADHFRYAYGLAPVLEHTPAMGDEHPGAPVAFYACATLVGGGSTFVVLSPAQVRELRGNPRPPQVPDPMHWMERKTCLRQLVKLLPKSATLARGLAADESVRTDLRSDALDAADPTPPAIGAPPPELVDVTDAELVPDDEDWPTPASVPGEDQ